MKINAIVKRLKEISHDKSDGVTEIELGGTQYKIHHNTEYRFNPRLLNTPNKIELDLFAERDKAMSLYGGSEYDVLNRLVNQVDALGDDMDELAKRRAERLIAFIQIGHAITTKYASKMVWKKKRMERVYDFNDVLGYSVHENIDMFRFDKFLGKNTSGSLTLEDIDKLKQHYIINIR